MPRGQVTLLTERPVHLEVIPPARQLEAVVPPRVGQPGHLFQRQVRPLAHRLLGLAEPPTAIVAGNDNQAFGVLQALGERGLRAPCDVSVVGFDDVIAEWATPPLTTIRQPLAAMTAAGFRMLEMGANGSPAQPQHVELATSLIVRDSTAPVP